MVNEAIYNMTELSMMSAECSIADNSMYLGLNDPLYLDCIAPLLQNSSALRADFEQNYAKWSYDCKIPSFSCQGID